jgi:Spy/CpxP family protein refolding chaperone
MIFHDKHLTLLIVIMSALLAALPLNAQPPTPTSDAQPQSNGATPSAPQRNILGEYLVSFGPELVLPNVEKLDLNDNQVQAIEANIDATKEQLSQAQETLKTEMGKLEQLLKAESGNEEAILAQLNKVLQTEQQIKSLHFSMLVRIRNQLTADQRGSLEEIRTGMIAQRQQLQQRIQGKFMQIQKMAQQYAQQQGGEQASQALVQSLQSAQQKLQQGNIAEGEAILDQTLQQLQGGAPAVNP